MFEDEVGIEDIYELNVDKFIDNSPTKLIDQMKLRELLKASDNRLGRNDWHGTSEQDCSDQL